MKVKLIYEKVCAKQGINRNHFPKKIKQIKQSNTHSLTTKYTMAQPVLSRLLDPNVGGFKPLVDYPGD